MENKDKNEENDGQSDTDNIHKIAITKDAEKSLSEMVEKVNDGYNGGRASKIGVASWIIIQFAKSISLQDIKNMRLEFLNEISLLEMALRRAKENGRLQPEMKRLLMQQMGFDEPVRRSAKSKVTQDQNAEAKGSAA